MVKSIAVGVEKEVENIESVKLDIIEAVKLELGSTIEVIVNVDGGLIY